MSKLTFKKERKIRRQEINKILKLQAVSNIQRYMSTTKKIIVTLSIVCFIELIIIIYMGVVI